MPRDREGRFSTDRFERYQRSEKALVSALAEMYVQGVSTCKVRVIPEEFCGHSFSASTMTLRRFAERPLEEPYPCLVLDARYEKVRLNGVILGGQGLAHASFQPLSSRCFDLPRT